MFKTRKKLEKELEEKEGLLERFMEMNKKLALNARNPNQTEITDETVRKYIQAFMPGAGLTEAETMAFCEIARQMQLNPFKREIYCVPYESNVKQPDGRWGKERKLSIITGYQVYLQRAEESGLLKNWKTWVDGEKAYIQIWRTDRDKPFEWEIVIKEYDQNNSMWQKKRVTMAKTVVIGQGFRMCFSKLLSGMPYTKEELPLEMTEIKDKSPKELPTVKEVVEELSEPAKICIDDEKTTVPEARKKGLLPEQQLDPDEMPDVPEEPLEKVVVTEDGEEKPVTHSLREAVDGAPEEPKATFKDIIAAVNGNVVPNERKPMVVIKASAAKAKPEMLTEIMKAIQEEDYDRISQL